VAPVVYVTARLPFGDGEPFVATEVRALERAGWQILVVPVRGSGEIVHPEASELRAESAPLTSWPIAQAAVSEVMRSPLRAGSSLASIAATRAPRIGAKNVSVLPKAHWLSGLVRRIGAEHIHAHWAGTSATMALVASRLSGIPWSFTAHRWDIAENNLLARKAREACFVRAISEHGAEELRRLVGKSGWSPEVIHMGVELPSATMEPTAVAGPLRVLTAARLVEKKGHAYLVEAIARLAARGIPARLDLAGDGPLRIELSRLVDEGRLDGAVRFLGTVSHADLLRRMVAGEWDLAVLPSVVTSSGELEGIPVALVEAMAAGLPVVGTTTGGMPELLADGAGVLVPPADPRALARALASLAVDVALRTRLAAAGRRRVEEQFDADRIAGQLGERFRNCSAVHFPSKRA
jgi:colanic acid/amylovoran biosynthesis glycosyltransferase